MEVVPVDLVGLVGTVMGISIVLIPVLGLTARFALKPTVEALGQFLRSRGVEESVHLLERRLDLVERQLESLDGSVRHLDDLGRFERQLGSGEVGGPAEPPEEPAP